MSPTCRNAVMSGLATISNPLANSILLKIALLTFSGRAVDRRCLIKTLVIGLDIRTYAIHRKFGAASYPPVVGAYSGTPSGYSSPELRYCHGGGASESRKGVVLQVFKKAAAMAPFVETKGSIPSGLIGSGSSPPVSGTCGRSLSGAICVRIVTSGTARGGVRQCDHQSHASSGYLH